jgi:plastocyanin
VGTDVTWRNTDPAPHTVSAPERAFDSGQLDPGATFTTPMDRAGTFAYLCQIHPSMAGEVIVR